MTLGITIRDAAATPRTLSAILMRDDANDQQALVSGYDRSVANVSELVFNPDGSLSLAVTIAPNTVAGFSSGTGTATSDEAVATATGGTAPYTYAWTLVASPNPCIANFPALGTTDFTMTGMGTGDSYIASWLVTVTDANSNTATASIDAIFSDIGGIL
jgi:hypothetical protein